jgi:hypothetical protein
MQEVSVGRIVRYVLPNGEERPAIVTRVVEGSTVGLHLFLDSGDAPFEPIDDVTGQAGVVRYSAESKVNTWHWPART